MQLLQDVFVIENLQVLSEGKNSGPTKIRGIFGRCNEKNNNGRIYPTSVLENQLAKVQPLINERRLCGELDHPQNDTVKLSNASHLITKLEMKGNELIGEAEILQTPAGLTAKALVDGGVKVGISSRGMGTLSEDHNGNKIVNEDFKLVTFDLVADPSTRGAYPALAESTESRFVQDSMTKLGKESNFITLLNSKLREAYQPWIDEAKSEGERADDVKRTAKREQATNDASKARNQAAQGRSPGTGYIAFKPGAPKYRHTAASDNQNNEESIKSYTEYQGLGYALAEAMELINELSAPPEKAVGDPGANINTTKVTVGRRTAERFKDAHRRAEFRKNLEKEKARTVTPSERGPEGASKGTGSFWGDWRARVHQHRSQVADAKGRNAAKAIDQQGEIDRAEKAAEGGGKTPSRRTSRRRGGGSSSVYYDHLGRDRSTNKAKRLAARLANRNNNSKPSETPSPNGGNNGVPSSRPQLPPGSSKPSETPSPNGGNNGVPRSSDNNRKPSETPSPNGGNNGVPRSSDNNRKPSENPSPKEKRDEDLANAKEVSFRVVSNSSDNKPPQLTAGEKPPQLTAGEKPPQLTAGPSKTEKLLPVKRSASNIASRAKDLARIRALRASGNTQGARDSMKERRKTRRKEWLPPDAGQPGGEGTDKNRLRAGTEYQSIGRMLAETFDLIESANKQPNTDDLIAAARKASHTQEELAKIKHRYKKKQITRDRDEELHRSDVEATNTRRKLNHS